MLSDMERLFLKNRRVAHLATADRDAAPHVVPVCFEMCNDTLYVTIDAKPKRSLSTPLKPEEYRSESSGCRCCRSL